MEPTLLAESPALRRLVVVTALIAVLLFDWQPDSHLLSQPAQRRAAEGTLPEDTGNVASHAARTPRAVLGEARRRRAEPPRPAARRRLPNR